MNTPGAEGPPPTPGSAPSLEDLQREIDSLRRINEEMRAGYDPLLQARLAAIIESSDDAIISKSLTGVIQTWNRGAQRIFGWTAEEVIGKAINIIIPPDRQSEEPQILSRIQRGERVDHFETIRMTKDGQLLDISVTISPVRDPTGKIVGASKIARDVTFQKRALRELQIAKEEAERANRAKDQFLSVLSHELRTPLTPILAELSFLEADPALSENVRTTLMMVRRNVETEARLVDDLLDLTRISRGKLQLRFEAVDVNEALRAVVNMLQTQIDSKNLELTIGLRARQHHVWADPGRLQQIFLNLLSNAVKFTPDGGSISIRTTTEDPGDHLRVEITDSGVGIEPDMMQRLFGAFEQSDRARRFGGLGLGLSIAKSLVDLHEGSISASSAGHDQGSRFVVTLPVTERRSDAARLVAASDAAQLKGLCVLLVEDHPDTRSVMIRLLQSLGCTVHSAGTVHDAIALTQQHDFNLLISDIGLPDGSGTDVMRHLQNRHVRGIALSGFGQEDDVQRSRDAGFETHMTKPINFQALRDAVVRYAHDS